MRTEKEELVRPAFRRLSSACVWWGAAARVYRPKRAAPKQKGKKQEVLF
jgi:hypothetical protein